jgi:hypothetical protein
LPLKGFNSLSPATFLHWSSPCSFSILDLQCLEHSHIPFSVFRRDIPVPSLTLITTKRTTKLIIDRVCDLISVFLILALYTWLFDDYVPFYPAQLIYNSPLYYLSNFLQSYAPRDNKAPTSLYSAHYSCSDSSFPTAQPSNTSGYHSDFPVAKLRLFKSMVDFAQDSSGVFINPASHIVRV